MANTEGTKKMEQKRLSPEVQNFKVEVIEFLKKTDASEEVKYKLSSDLSVIIDMPFYHERKLGRKNRMKTPECAKEYVRLLIQYNDISFAEKLLSWITRQQNQTLRKLYRLTKRQKYRKKKYVEETGKKGVYEHPIPVNYTKKLLLKYINEGNYEGNYKEACSYIDYLYTNVPQIHLTESQDEQVNAIYRDDMPEGWNWKKDNPFERYIRAGIPEEVYSDESCKKLV